MKTWIVLWGALMIGACATNQPINVPEWEDAQRPEAAITYPIELPQLCEISASGQWSVACWRRLEAYDIVASGNTDIARDNAEALRSTEEAYDALIRAGKYQRELARIRQEMLNEERRQRTWDRWFYRTVLAGLAIIGVATQ